MGHIFLQYIMHFVGGIRTTRLNQNRIGRKDLIKKEKKNVAKYTHVPY